MQAVNSLKTKNSIHDHSRSVTLDNTNIAGTHANLQALFFSTRTLNCTRRFLRGSEKNMQNNGVNYANLIKIRKFCYL